jgi:hypothetical protein
MPPQSLRRDTNAYKRCVRHDLDEVLVCSKKHISIVGRITSMLSLRAGRGLLQGRRSEKFKNRLGLTGMLVLRKRFHMKAAEQSKDLICIVASAL